MTLTLRDLQVGDRCRITGMAKEQVGYRKKLLAMGLTRGTEIEIVRLAPLGDPLEISVRGFSLSLRKEEAATLIVEKV